MKKIKGLVSVRNIIELLFMCAFYLILNGAGIKKYIVALALSAVFFFLGRKKKWSADILICIAISPVIYLTFGAISTLLNVSPQTTSIKEVLFWIVPLIVAFSMYTYYGESMSHIVDIQFWASCVAYIYPRFRFIMEHVISESTYAFVFGAYVIYFAYQKRYGKLMISLGLMFLANKRIALLASVVSIFVLFVMWLFKKSKEVAIVVWGIVASGIFYYVFLIRSGLLRFFCNTLGIDSKGRVQTYARFSEMYDFSPVFWGKGLGNIENILNNWQIKYYGNLHNDLLKFYLEIGFVGLLLFLASYGVVFLIVGRRIGKSQMCFMLTIVIYFMLLCATDNISIYILYLIPMYSMLFAVLSKRQDDRC